MGFFVVVTRGVAIVVSFVGAAVVTEDINKSMIEIAELDF
jgi:hypothetical protein